MNNHLKNIPGIYIFTNLVSGKVYVGESINIKKRIGQYKTPRKKRAFENALIKYGIKSFRIEVEYFHNYTKADLLILEELLIRRFNCISPNGYNICKKGQDTTGVPSHNKGKLMTDVQKRKISLSHIGLKHSDESKLKISNYFKGRVSPNKGKKASIETIEKIRESNIGNTKRRIPVEQITLDGEFIAEFPSIEIASLKTRSSRCHISSVCKGKRNKTGGYKWRYKS